MNRISGKVVLKESGVGIPDLLVVIYDADTTEPVDIGSSAAAATTPPSPTIPRPTIPCHRLGSTLTRRDGSFELAFDDAEFQIQTADKKRPSLLLNVIAPEDTGTDPDSRVLFASSSVRYNAGRTEQYLIRLTAEQMERAGVPLPTTYPDEIEDPARIVERLTRAGQRLETIDNGFRLLDTRRVELVRQTANDFKSNLKPAFQAMLSRVSERLGEHPLFVAPGESIFTKSITNMQREVEQIINGTAPEVRAPITSFIALTDEQKQSIADHINEDGEIAADNLETILGGREPRGSSTTFLLHEDPQIQFCRDRSQEEMECRTILGISQPVTEEGIPEETSDQDDPGSGEVPGKNKKKDHDKPGRGSRAANVPVANKTQKKDIPGHGVESADEEGINSYVARLIDTMTSPEEHVVYGLHPLATQGEVEEDIKELVFPPSPADTLAFYDFHNLQIAFEPVWQELIDKGILDLAEDAYHDIVELGGNPNQISDEDVYGPVHALLEEGKTVLTSRRVVYDHQEGAMTRDTSGQVKVRDHRGQAIVSDDHAKTITAPTRPGQPKPGTVVTPEHPAERLPKVLAELEQRLKENYNFTIYAANSKERSINFGMLVTYRQKWEPLAYQAGKLVKTITLAPKETQKYSRKTVIHRKRAEKEVENHLRSRREEASETSRAEQDIIRKATTDTNFTLNAQNTLSVPLGEGASVGGSRTTTFVRNANRISEDVKKAFHEAVFKSAQEYKDEHTLEVNTEETEDLEIIESGEITNPNDEIAVTFLFYELQRRYRISERIHQITPVIFVAQEMPRPDEIDEDWLLCHDWVLRRVLLDDSFVPALNYLSQNIVGEEVALEELRLNVEKQRQVVEELRQELGVMRDRLSGQRRLLDQAIARQLANAQEEENGGGWIPGFPDPGDVGELVEKGLDRLGDLIFGSDGAEGTNPLDALREAYQRAADEARDILFRLEREVTALNATTETYSKALAEYLNHKAQVARLRVHVKQNILHYMQAIWSHEPPDQRFFRLHNVKVPILQAERQTYLFPNLHPAVSTLTALPHRRLSLNNLPATNLYPVEVVTEIDPNFEFTALAEVADLDKLLGFKGNYMIFPLRESNALTDYMMAPYIVAGFDELADPDDLGNWTLDDFAQYVSCLKANLTDEQFEAIKDQLREQYERLLTEPQRNGDVIVVPTNSLFIEALPARHSLIEEFKARHRAIDVKKVQAEVREMELDNIRAAARILDRQLDDPDIESVKQVFVQKGIGKPDIDIGDE